MNLAEFSLYDIELNCNFMIFTLGIHLPNISIIYFVLQEVLLWIKSVVDECGENITKDQLKDYVWKTLNSGKVSPHFYHNDFLQFDQCLVYIINDCSFLSYMVGSLPFFRLELLFSSGQYVSCSVPSSRK